MNGNRLRNNRSNEWKVYNTSNEYWHKMIQYYKWLSTSVIFVFALVLLIECQFAAGISLIVISVLFTPCKPVRRVVDRVSAAYRKIILLLAAAVFIISIVTAISMMAL